MPFFGFIVGLVEGVIPGFILGELDPVPGVVSVPLPVPPVLEPFGEQELARIETPTSAVNIKPIFFINPRLDYK